MTNRIKSWNTFLPFLHYPQAEFDSEILAPPLPQWHRETGHGGWGQFIICGLCATFLLIQRTPSPAPAQGPSHGNSPSLTPPAWVLGMDCSSPWTAPVGSLPLSAVLQEPCGPPWGSQGLPPNLLQRGFLSPQGYRSCQDIDGLGPGQGSSILGSLALALPDMAEASGNLQQKTPLQRP